MLINIVIMVTIVKVDTIKEFKKLNKNVTKKTQLFFVG